MKNLFTLLFIVSFVFTNSAQAQNITNTLGANGTYVVEDVNNSSIIRASRTGSQPKLIVGDWESAFNLPSGNVNFIHNNGTEKLNLVVGKSGAFSAFPKLYFHFTPGSLTAPTTVDNNDDLGIIGFGGFNNGGWEELAAQIYTRVDGTPGVRIPTKLIFQTQGNTSGSSNNMELDSNGNLTIPGSTTLNGSFSTPAKATLTNAITLDESDHTLVCSFGGTTTVTLPTVSADTHGKTYIIKAGMIATGQVDIVTGNGETIDGNASITLDTNWEYIRLQAIFQTVPFSVTTWVIVGGNYTP